MNNKAKSLLILALATGASALPINAQVSTTQTVSMTEKSIDNPFFHKSALQYQAPEFDKIKDSDYEPAFVAGLKQQANEIQAIVTDPRSATFANTILAIETSGEILKRAQMVFFNITSSNTNPTLQALEEKYAPIFAKHSDEIFLNSNLYARVHNVYLNRASLGLDFESVRLVEYYEQLFEMAGANLSAEKKEELKAINQRLATLETVFGSKLLGATKNGAVVVDDVKELDGLPADQIEALKADAAKAGMPGKYYIALQNTTQQPVLMYLKNRALRERIFKASWNRAEQNDANDTRSTVEEIAKLRLRKAQVLGKDNFADWKLQDQMAKNEKNAMDLLASLAVPSVDKAKQEAAEIQALIDKQGGDFKVEPWDWQYYSEQVRKEKYDLDESQIKPYFEVRTVLEKGVFYAAEKLYGITFKARKDLPVYNPDVMAYEVFDNNGKSLALYYLDFYARDSKRGGAWMNNFVNQSFLLGQKPVICNVYNFQKPAEGKPSLVSWDDVSTMFHEFGHTLHGLFANQKYESLSGTSVPRDFVEFPSQINENWASDPTVLKNYALHYQTKKVIPQALVDKMMKSGTFNIGYVETELLAAATLDMAWHAVTDSNQLKPVDEFENEALAKYNILMKEVPTRYSSSYFAHIWNNGYSAGYYAYVWADMLKYNAVDYFNAHGGLTRENGDRFRKYILSVGNSVDLNKNFEEFTGKKPTIEPILRGKGLE